MNLFNEIRLQMYDDSCRFLLSFYSVHIIADKLITRYVYSTYFNYLLFHCSICFLMVLLTCLVSFNTVTRLLFLVLLMNLLVLLITIKKYSNWFFTSLRKNLNSMSRGSNWIVKSSSILKTWETEEEEISELNKIIFKSRGECNQKQCRLKSGW